MNIKNAVDTSMYGTVPHLHTCMYKIYSFYQKNVLNPLRPKIKTAFWIPLTSGIQNAVFFLYFPLFARGPSLQINNHTWSFLHDNRF